MSTIKIDPDNFARVHGNVGFNPIVPIPSNAGDNRCCCRFCSPNDRVLGDNPAGVWDTLATDLVTGETWAVHFPELHFRVARR